MMQNYQENLRKLLLVENEDVNEFSARNCKPYCKKTLTGSENQHVYLVADEVGLGKTIVAKGVIESLSKIKKKEGEPFRVVYICSSQVIARQNLEKLAIGNTQIVNSDESRLSMHSLIQLKEEQRSGKNQDIQLIPLTPGTSFAEGSWCTGLVNERAYIYAVLKLLGIAKDEAQLNSLKKGAGDTNWKKLTGEENKDESYCEKIKSIEKDLKKIFSKHIDELETILESSNEISNKNVAKLRTIFSNVSLDLLNPNLIILDEFQNFKKLIERKNKEDNDLLRDIDRLVKKFFKYENNKYILMLSATPYKQYSTNQDIQEENDSHRAQFDSVIDFLIDNNFEKKNQFEKEWTKYSRNLTNVSKENTEELEKSVNKVSDIMFSLMARTERNAVLGNTSLIQIEIPKSMVQNKNDILAYYQFANLLKQTNTKNKYPYIDYNKSCPFLMSYIQYYAQKNDLKNHMDTYKKIPEKDQTLLWLDTNIIRKYGKNDSENYLVGKNARLTALISEVFNTDIEDFDPSLLLWIPPTKPYYEMGGAYKNCTTTQYLRNPFSKYLVFSDWEIVPRMISTLISYEAEKSVHENMMYKGRTKDKFEPRDYDNPDKPKYFNFKNVTQEGNEKKNKYFRYYIYTWIYPSKYLASLYNPFDYMGQPIDLIKNKISEIIKEDILKAGFTISETNTRGSASYTLIPMYFDNLEDNHFEKWKNQLDKLDVKFKNKTEFELNYKGQKKYLDLDILNENEKTLPKDICEILTDEVLGSPAVCLYRLLQDSIDENTDKPLANITKLAYEYCKYFDSPENVAVVNDIYNPKPEDDDEGDDDQENEGDGKKTKIYWKNALKYCGDGCLQAVLDEFYDLLGTSNFKRVIDKFLSSINLFNASYEIDTRDNFISGKDENKTFKMRTHYAVCFTKAKDDNSGVNRRDSVRNTFNSPFKPFVLATTSVGQEGLDFHNYCRKIVHWNLPRNAIEIEQREGRINRYKCLAIRQSIARDYNFIRPEKYHKIWDNLYKQIPEKKEYSHLYPFWCYIKENNEDIVKIERILLEYVSSKDRFMYENLEETLYKYRMTLGQPNQEELCKFLQKELGNDEMKKELFINISPYFRGFKR